MASAAHARHMNPVHCFPCRTLARVVWISAAVQPLSAAPPADPPPTGLAAEYPGDAGIARDPRVLLAEDFEQGDVEDLKKRWTEISNKDGKVVAVVDDASAGAGRRALRMTATLGENTGGHLYKLLPREVDRYYARFYVKFDPAGGYIHHFVHLGGYRPATRWPQGGAGERPRGDERITVGIEPHGRYGTCPPPGAWCFYNYWHEMKISAGEKYWGNAISPDAPLQIQPGRWQCVEVMVKLNSTREAADGELALWLDGREAMRIAKGTPRATWSGMGFDLPKEGGEPFEGFRWRTSTDLKLNFFWLLFYVTENAPRQNKVAHPPNVTRVWFDHIVVATDYVGPVVAKSAKAEGAALK